MKKVLKWAGIGFIALIVIGVIAGMSGSSENSSTTNTASKKDAPVQEPQVIEVVTLADAFDANQVAAEQEWKDKYVQFSAEISNITDSGLSFTNIATKQYSMTQISCQIKDKQQLLSVKNGDIVTVKGFVGDQTIGVISLDDCEIVQ